MLFSTEFRRILNLERALGRCPSCGANAIVADSHNGESACGNCGFVVSDKVVDAAPEWGRKEDGTERSRAGPAASKMRSGLSTGVGRADRDASGRSLPAGQAYRLRMWDRRIPERPGDLNLGQAFEEVERLADRLALPVAVKETAAQAYAKAHDRGLVRGRTTSAVAAACIYLSCRELNLPRTLKDFENACAQRGKKIPRDYRLLLRELDVKAPVPDIHKMLPGIASSAGVSEKTKRTAGEILRRVRGTLPTGVKFGLTENRILTDRLQLCYRVVLNRTRCHSAL